MRILIVSQVFWPDNVAVSLFVSDLADQLAERGHDITVIAGQYDYENHKIKYPRNQQKEGIRISRLRNSGLGKSSPVFRLIDFFTFNFLVLLRLASYPRGRFDLVIVSTVPPMLPFITALFAKKIARRFYYWVMDLQPDLAIQAGLLRKKSFAAKSLIRMGDYVFKKSDHIFTLDCFMKDHIAQRTGTDHKISVSPLWPAMTLTYHGDRLENPFRKANGFGDKIVIMYSGNHSLVHPLETLLKTAKELKDDDRFLFVLIGSGVRKKEAAAFRKKHGLKNIVQLPFQPREEIHISLSSADIQVVILGDGQVGYTHPNKIYGALFLGRTVLYIGPEPSHVSEILKHSPGNISVRHGEADRLKEELIKLAENRAILEKAGNQNKALAEKNMQPDMLKEALVRQMEQLMRQNAKLATPGDA